MLDLTRRQFVQSASLLLGTGYAGIANGAGLGPFTTKKASSDPIGSAPAGKSFQPTALFLTWQRDPTTTMTIQWVGTEQEAANRPVSFAKEGSHTWATQKGAARRFPMTDLWIFRTELTGLEPGTEYRFRVGADSAEERFRTMPAKATNTIHFISGGDSGIGSHAVHTNRIAAAQSPMFVVMAGDLAYENGKAPAVFLQFLKNYSRDLRDDRKRMIPMLACLGNHEVDGGYRKSRKEAPFFYAFFDGLFRDTSYATLDFGDYLSVILLDTNHTSPIEGDQTDWLERNLKQREEFPTVFAFNHVPAYPSFRPFQYAQGEKGTGSENRKYWVPLFERYNVDAVFEHHDHTYKRTHPLLGGRVNENGIVYLGDGSWGKLRRPEGPEKRPYLAVTDEAYHLSLHRIEGKQRYHVAMSDTGKVVDVCSTMKRSHRRTT